jgi:hypothetical protein
VAGPRNHQADPDCPQVSGITALVLITPITEGELTVEIAMAA